MEEVKKLARDPRVLTVEAHQCQFGLTSPIRRGEVAVGPAKKPTGFMTNCPGIAEQLSRKCDKSHEHVPLIGESRGGGHLSDGVV